MADPMFVAQRHNASNQMSLNISDVIDIIGQDTDYGSSNQSVYDGMQMSGAPSTAPSEGSFDPELESKRKAYVKVLEQPQPKALRFRYICEGRSAGSIPGIRSTAENKTYPAIQVCGYKGPAVVVVSCVTVDPPYRPHPHNLVGKEGCKKGVCTMQINSETMTCVFSNLGIQCVKKRDVEEALRLREEIRVDPFQTGFTHRNNPQSIDLNSVRLCFQVFLQGANKKHFTFPLKASVSEAIYDKKATSDLIICKLSDCTSSVAGGKEIILLCDKVTKEDIQVRFYEVKDGMIHWESFGDFQASDVHKQVAISFKTPRYKVLEIENPVKVYIELVRPSDNAKSEARPFTYLPLDSGRPFTSFKRLKNNYGLFQRILGLESPSAMDASQDNLMHKTPTKRTQDSLMEDVKISTTSHLALNIPQASITVDGNLTTLAPASVISASTIASSTGSVATKPPSGARPISPPIGSLGPNQSVDDIRQRMTASLRKGGSGTTSPRPQPPKTSPFWSDDGSVYSDTDMLDDVLSQGSVNDLLSAVGEGFTVYEDVTGFSDPPNENIQLLAPDTVYGDASYASCYSNLEFVMGQARAAQIAKDQPPVLPPKHSPSNAMIIDDENEDYGLYEIPSSRPIHANKASLLQERGFRIGGVNTAVSGAVVTKSESSVDNALYYDPNQASHDLAELLDDPGTQPTEVNSEVVPRTILDLFV